MGFITACASFSGVVGMRRSIDLRGIVGFLPGHPGRRFSISANCALVFFATMSMRPLRPSMRAPIRFSDSTSSSSSVSCPSRMGPTTSTITPWNACANALAQAAQFGHGEPRKSSPGTVTPFLSRKHTGSSALACSAGRCAAVYPSVTRVTKYIIPLASGTGLVVAARTPSGWIELASYPDAWPSPAIFTDGADRFAFSTGSSVHVGEVLAVDEGSPVIDLRSFESPDPRAKSNLWSLSWSPSGAALALIRLGAGTDGRSCR